MQCNPKVQIVHCSSSQFISAPRKLRERDREKKEICKDAQEREDESWRKKPPDSDANHCPMIRLKKEKEKNLRVRKKNEDYGGINPPSSSPATNFSTRRYIHYTSNAPLSHSPKAASDSLGSSPKPNSTEPEAVVEVVGEEQKLATRDYYYALVRPMPEVA